MPDTLWSTRSFPADNKMYLWGDKDTFPIAFAAAGKAHIFSQVSIPPGMENWGIPRAVYKTLFS